MAHFTLPTWDTGGVPAADVAVDFEEADDNLFILIDGKRTFISVWFHREHGKLFISLGTPSLETDEWAEAHTIEMPA